MFRLIINGQRGAKRLFISIGLTFIIISLLVFTYPEFFAYLFAGLMGVLGLLLVISGVLGKKKDPPNPPFGGGGYQDTEESTYKEVDD